MKRTPTRGATKAPPPRVRGPHGHRGRRGPRPQPRPRTRRHLYSNTAATRSLEFMKQPLCNENLTKATAACTQRAAGTQHTSAVLPTNCQPSREAARLYSSALLSFPKLLGKNAQHSPLGGEAGSRKYLKTTAGLPTVTMAGVADGAAHNEDGIDAKCKVLLVHPRQLTCTNCDGWTVHYAKEPLFPGDDPRTAHSLKIIAPRLFPHARTIVSGDTKCPHSQFYHKAKSQAEYETVDGFFLKHPR
jgi:hypothetical protein